MKFSMFVLLSAAVGIGAIGIGYVLAPQWVYGLYGIGIDSVNEANMVRAAYGGLFVSSALLFALGATNEELTRSALIYLLVFMLGLAGGRMISVLVDGVPSGLIILVQGGVLVYITLASLALYRRRN
ncbi:MAG: DUF4345 domain-containing protein [Chloroflexota bacterium]|nr:DUF4345 domain-containing protein [Chloroflexota bacterium]